MNGLNGSINIKHENNNNARILYFVEILRIFFHVKAQYKELVSLCICTKCIEACMEHHKIRMGLCVCYFNNKHEL